MLNCAYISVGSQELNTVCHSGKVNKVGLTDLLDTFNIKYWKLIATSQFLI